jgi:hypothetical protein
MSRAHLRDLDINQMKRMAERVQESRHLSTCPTSVRLAGLSDLGTRPRYWRWGWRFDGLLRYYHQDRVSWRQVSADDCEAGPARPYTNADALLMAMTVGELTTPIAWM